MKRVATVTFHRAYNLGAELQAYALQSVLDEKYDAQILDYHCEHFENKFSLRKVLKEKTGDCIRFLLYPKYAIDLKKKKYNFKMFQKKYYCLSSSYTPLDVNTSNSSFDAFVSGSDQVWNPRCSGEDYNYFLDFAKIEKRFSYAASFGGDKVTNHPTDKMLKLLSLYQKLLVREQSGKDFLEKKMLGLKASVVLDPVLLLEKEEWNKRFSLDRNPEGNDYVVIYIQAPQTKAIDVAKRYAKEHGLKIVYINGGKPSDKEIIYRNDIGPIQFLGLIYNANLVVTTSFHALAFSVLFNSKVLYELSDQQENINSRLSDFAKLVGIEDKEINSTNEVIATFDWTRINEKLDQLRVSSRQQLFEMLSNI